MRDVFICDGLRTPIGRYGGALAGVRPDDLAAHVVRELVARHDSLDPSRIDEVVFGCANQAGEDNRNIARMALLLAGLPPSVPGTTVNRLCASGMDAVIAAARAVRSGEIDLAIAGGVESMSRAPFVMPKVGEAFSRANEVHDTTIGWRFVNPTMRAAHGVDSMPETAENVAVDYAVVRADQDAFALRSQLRYAAAKTRGFFDGELVAVAAPARRGAPVEVAADEHPRPETTIESLAALKPVARAGGSVTAGNASGVNDGACALLVASGEAARAHGLRPLARIVGAASAGVAPRVMGVGPIPSTQRLLHRLRLAVGEFDVVELNEAFAAQALAVLRGLGLADDDPCVNPNGGAIALGHPLGMSGARIVLTAARQLQAVRGRRALATMCVGVGQGVSLVLEAP